MIFKVFPFNPNISPNQLATPERRLAETEGFTHLQATEARVFAQIGRKQIGIFDVRGAKLQQLGFSDEIQDFLPHSNRLLVQTSREIQLFDDQGKLLSKQALVAAISPQLAAFEGGFAYQATERSIQLLDFAGKVRGEIKVTDKIRGLRSARERLGVQLEDQLQIFDVNGARVAEFKAPSRIERLTASQERFYVQRGQELTVLSANDGRVIKDHRFKNKLENMEGFGKHLMVIVRDPEGRL